MVNKIEQFLSEKFGTVRAIKDDNSIIWFVAVDVAKILNYTTTQKATDKVDDDDIIKLPKTQLTNFGNWEQTGGKDVILINEGGLYQIVSSVTKKDMVRYELSRDFKRWITNEVLPTIRETGAYIENNREQEVVDKYFKGLSDETKLIVFKELQANNEKLQVKAEKHDAFLEIDDSVTFEELSKMLSTRAKEEYNLNVKLTKISLPKYLRDKGILNKSKKGSSYSNLPNQGYEKYFNVVSRTVGENSIKTQTRVKPIGLDFIYDELVLDGFQLN